MVILIFGNFVQCEVIFYFVIWFGFCGRCWKIDEVFNIDGFEEFENIV